MNNSYGYAMSDSLPYEGLELIEVTDETINEALTASNDSEYEYYLDVQRLQKIKKFSNGSRKNESTRRYATTRTNRN